MWVFSILILPNKQRNWHYLLKHCIRLSLSVLISDGVPECKKQFPAPAPNLSYTVQCMPGGCKMSCIGNMKIMATEVSFIKNVIQTSFSPGPIVLYPQTTINVAGQIWLCVLHGRICCEITGRNSHFGGSDLCAMINNMQSDYNVQPNIRCAMNCLMQ